MDSLLYGEYRIYQDPYLLSNGSNEAIKESDVFSFARLMYYLITGFEPFQMNDDPLKRIAPFKFLSHINKGEFPLIPDYVPKPLRKLLKRSWNPYPYERPSMKEIFFSFIYRDLYINDFQPNEDFQKFRSYIDELLDNEFSVKFGLVIEYNAEATIDIELEDEKINSLSTLNRKLDSIIHSKFMRMSKNKILNLLIKMANYEYIQNDVKRLQKVMSFVNNLSPKKHELSKDFLNIVFGKPINDISVGCLICRQELNIANTVHSIPVRFIDL